jgi:cytoskeleton protein RodZ
MTSVGETLRRERERQGRQMAEIAKELCITQRYLSAIEKDDLKSLPGNFFYKSFVKQYAAILGVNEQSLEPGVNALTASYEPVLLPGADHRYTAQGHDPASRYPSSPVRQLDPIVEDANRRYVSPPHLGLSLTGLAAVLLVCSGFYAWWNKAPQARPPAPVAVEQTAAPPAAVEVKASEPVSEPAEPTVNLTTTTGSDGLNHVVLNLSATEKTWLSITTSDGKRIFSGILEPSQTKTLTGLEVAKMKVGNAGGLEVLWNGKPIGPIGPRGQVRVVLFTPENFQILGPSETL